MNPITQELVQATLQGRLEDALNASGSKLTAQIAEDASKAFLEASAARDGATALATSMVASRIYERLGDRQNQLLNLINFSQTQFQVASTTQQYDSVHQGALQIVKLADQAGLAQFGFYSAVTAADAAFFAAQSFNNDRSWLTIALRDVVTAFDRAKSFTADPTFFRLVDLAASVVNRVMRWVLFNDQEEAERRALLQRVAAQVDELVPDNFESPGNPQQTAKIAAILAELSDGYGAKS